MTRRLTWVLALAVAGAGIGLGGCGAQHLTVERMAGQEGKGVEGICYSLPKTVLQVNVILTVDQLVRPDDWQHPERGPEYVGAVRATADVTPLLVADGNERYVIKGDTLSKAVMLATNLSFQLDDQGLLLAADATIADRTGEVIRELTTTAVELAKIATRGTLERTPADDLQERIEQIYKELAAERPAGESAARAVGGGAANGVRPGGGAGGSGGGGGGAGNGGAGGGDAEGPPERVVVTSPALVRIQVLQQELRLLKETLKQYREDHEIKRVAVSVPFSVTVDPAAFAAHAGGGGEAGYLEGTVMLPEMAGQKLGKLVIRIYDASAGESGGSAEHVAAFDGLVYRPARSLVTQVLVEKPGRMDEEGKMITAEPLVVGSRFVNYPQFSPRAFVRIESKLFGETATRVAFSPVSGGIRTVNGNANASAVEMAKTASAVAETAGEIQQMEEKSTGGGGRGGTTSGSTGSTGGSKTAAGSGSASSGATTGGTASNASSSGGATTQATTRSGNATTRSGGGRSGGGG